MARQQKILSFSLWVALGFLFSFILLTRVNAEETPPASTAPPAGGATAPADEESTKCGSVCQWITANYPAPPGYIEGDGVIPKCAFSGQCRNTNDLVQIFINQSKYIFGLIGVVALAAFVYGGFLMVFSFGKSEKVQQGKDVMVAAVIGIIIVFSAYLIVNFILNALGVGVEFQAIK